VLHGFSYPNYLAEFSTSAQSEVYQKSTLDLAMRDAFIKIRRFLMTTKGLSEDEATSRISVGCRFWRDASGGRKLGRSRDYPEDAVYGLKRRGSTPTNARLSKSLFVATQMPLFSDLYHGSKLKRAYRQQPDSMDHECSRVSRLAQPWALFVFADRGTPCISLA
jgi:hypothetical protein